jgi:hypothetical protein
MQFSSARRPLLFALVALSLVSLDAADVKVSRQQADAFTTKVNTIIGPRTKATGSRRTSVTESELNSWFAYRAQPLLPSGLAEPSLSMIGEGRVSGRAIVDLDKVAKKKATGGAIDPWSYIGGRVPLLVTGKLDTKDGTGRFVLESAQVANLPVPKFLLQELLSSYSKTPDNPDGFSMDDPFTLPANIQKIEVKQGEAVVVQ